MLGQKACHHKFGLFEQEYFNIFSCSWCYFFLFQSKNVKPVPGTYYLAVSHQGGAFPPGTILTPDITNDSLSSNVCKTLNDDECIRWQECCSKAHDCCERQIATSSKRTNSCSSTWDGYLCWDEAEPNSLNYISCPPFLQYSMPTRKYISLHSSKCQWMIVDCTRVTIVY